MTSWASSLATGQNVQVATPQEYAVQAGPGTYQKGGGKVWSSSFDPTTGLVTFTNPGNPRQTWTADLSQAGSEMNIDPAYIKQWQDDRNKYLQYQKTQATGGKSTAQMDPQSALAWQSIQDQYKATGQMPGIEAQTQASITQANVDAAKYSQLGDTQEQQAQQLYGVGYQELSDADKQIVDANALVKMTTTGEGLFPAQQAMIEQARQSEETQLASTLGTAGLGKSTQLAQLTGAADLGAAATAGQLQQGNIQAAEQVMAGALGQQAGAQKTLGLGQTQEQVAQQSYQLSQAAQKISLAGQELLAGEQKQLTDELAKISDQSSALHKQFWDEAMQGYGTMGTIIKTASESYGYSLDAYKSVLHEMEEHTKTEAGAQEAAAKSDSSATGSLLGALGTAVGAYAGSAAGSAAIGAAITAAFCEVGQTLFGFDSPKWPRFRAWLLFRGPRWFLKFYGKNAHAIAGWVEHKTMFKAILRAVMNVVLYLDAIAH